MGKRRSTSCTTFIPLLSVLALLLQQLALIPCIAALSPEPDHDKEVIAATEMSFYDLIAADQYTRRTCNGKIGECNAEEEEIMMESDISRRFLAAQDKTIVYPVIMYDRAACRNVNGKTYGNCGSGGTLPSKSNPSNRGCRGYYLCRDNH